VVVTLLCAAQLTFSAPAQANSLVILGPQLSQIMLSSLGAGSQCIYFVHDENGNRISQTAATIGAGPTLWGAGSFGCFVWNQ
ncbi:unnamed protein product, partial [Laminaria digitata]